MIWFTLFDAGGDSITFLDYISKAGVVVLLIIILYGGFKRWWVWGWMLKEAEERAVQIGKDRDEWKRMALQGTSLAERAMERAKE